MKSGRSYHFTWRSDMPHVRPAVSIRKRVAEDTIMDPDRDSEEDIVASEASATIHDKEARIIARGRSPIGIFVHKEFRVNDNLLKTKSDGDRSEVASVGEDKLYGKAPSSHI